MIMFKYEAHRSSHMQLPKHSTPYAQLAVIAVWYSSLMLSHQDSDRLVINTADDSDSDTALETEYSYNDQLRKKQLRT